MNQDEILTKYNNSMSELEHQFPMDIESLKQHHKSIISKILPLELQSSIPTSLQKLLDSSFLKFQEENEQIYINSLYTFLTNQFASIKPKSKTIHIMIYRNISRILHIFNKVSNQKCKRVLINSCI